jgi:hypothetical protein
LAKERVVYSSSGKMPALFAIWKMFWKYTNGLTIPSDHKSVWMKRANNYRQKPDNLCQQSPVHLNGLIMNTSEKE